VLLYSNDQEVSERGKGVLTTMNNQVLSTGSRVRVISYGPFRGLKGTIRKVDAIPGLEAGEAFCFYLVELEGKHIKEPIWFECDEVELVDCNLQIRPFLGLASIVLTSVTLCLRVRVLRHGCPVSLK
jgi:hypothetical protein